MNEKRFGLFFLALVVLSVPAAYAQRDNNQGNRQVRAGMQQTRMVAGVFATMSPVQALMIAGQSPQLNLTDDQKSNMNQLLVAYRSDLNAVPADSKDKLSLSARLETANKELRDALLSKDVTVEVIQQKLKACRDAEDAINVVNLKYWEQIRNTLDENQLKQLNELLSARPSRPAGNNPADNQNRSNRALGNRRGSEQGQ